MTPRPYEATRYLCAAVHSSAQLRSFVLKQLVWEKHKAIPTSYGVDVTAVAKHAIVAERRSLRQDLLLLIPFLAACIFYVPVAVAREDPWNFLLFPIVLIAFVIVLFRNWNQMQTVRKLRKGCDTCDLMIKPKGKAYHALSLVTDREMSPPNVVVYSGFSPFVGSGIDLGGWSFVANPTKGKFEGSIQLEPIPFTVEELYDSITNDILALNLKNLSIEDKLYVNGQDIREDNRFLTNPLGPPVRSASPELVSSFRESPTEMVRYYKCFRTIEWGGELIFSTFIRFAKSSSSLFIETSYFLLTPISDTYRAVDKMPPEPTAKEIVETAVTSLVVAPFICAFVPFILMNKYGERRKRLSEAKAREKEIKHDYQFDYGSTASLRAAAASPNYKRYFQKLDKEMNHKLIERTILDSISLFLDGRDIDTSDFSERRTTILNNGVIMSGGHIQTESFSGGAGAVSTIIKGLSSASRQTKPLGEHAKTN